jgi:uncharacterized membrane protein YgcG
MPGKAVFWELKTISGILFQDWESYGIVDNCQVINNQRIKKLAGQLKHLAQNTHLQSPLKAGFKLPIS